MFLRDSTRPDVGSEVLDGLGLADAAEWIAHDRFDELEKPEGDPSISLNPELEVFPELVLEDGESRGGTVRVRLPLLGGQARSVDPE